MLDFRDVWRRKESIMANVLLKMGISQLNCTERHFKIKIAKAQNEWKCLDDTTVTGREMRLVELICGWCVFWQSSCFFTLLWRRGLLCFLFSTGEKSPGDHSASSVTCNYLPLDGEKTLLSQFGQPLGSWRWDTWCWSCVQSLHNSTSLSI